MPSAYVLDDRLADGAPPTPTDELDRRSLSDWLAAHVEGFEGPLEVRRFAGGQSNPTYQLVTPGRRYVLRRKPSGPLLKSAHAVDREYRVIRAVGRAGFPVPEAFALCEDEGVVGSIFYVMEMVDGRIHWNGRLPDHTPADRAEIYQAQIRTLAWLHSLSPEAIGLADFGAPGRYCARQLARWTKQYRASEIVRIEAMDRLIGWLPTSLPPEQPTRVVHGDFRLDNMVLHPNENRVIAVLDWELSTLGDPVADLTYLLMHWVMPADHRNSLAGLAETSPGAPTMEEALSQYVDLTGAAVTHLEWYLAFNLFRLAAIGQGIAARHRDGTASNPRAATAQSRVAPLAETAWGFARRAGAHA